MKPTTLTEAEIQQLRFQVAARDNYRCILCDKSAVDIAHIVPRSHGARNSATLWQPKNLASSCRACHIETKAQRRKLLKRMQELYGYSYDDQPFARYLIEEET